MTRPPSKTVCLVATARDSEVIAGSPLGDLGPTIKLARVEFLLFGNKPGWSSILICLFMFSGVHRGIRGDSEEGLSSFHKEEESLYLRVS